MVLEEGEILFFDTSNYKTETLEEDIEKYAYHGVVEAHKLPGGGTEVIKEMPDGSVRLNYYAPNGHETGTRHSHTWGDDEGNYYHRD